MDITSPQHPLNPANPMNPLSPISPLNPNSPIYQSPPVYPPPAERPAGSTEVPPQGPATLGGSRQDDYVQLGIGLFFALAALVLIGLQEWRNRRRR